MTFELRKWQRGDEISVAKYADDPSIAANLRNIFPNPYTLEDAKGYVYACADDNENRQICRAIIIDGEAVGSVGIFLQDDVYEKSGEIGYWLAQKYWGKGIMTSAVKQLCKEAFEKYDIVRIFSEPYATNVGSRHVLEKSGFELEGIMRKGVYKNGEFKDYCMYAVIK